MNLKKSGAFWDSEVQVPTHASWLSEPDVRLYANEAVSGNPHGWPLDALQHFLGGGIRERALSIGCGTGALERDLIFRKMFDHVDAFDGSIGSLAVARSEAGAAGMAEQIHYFASDFNAPVLPANRYDAVFVHQALHHVSALEKLFLAIGRALKPGGFLYFDEYVGPSRLDWNESVLEFHRSLFEEISADEKRTDRLALPIQPDDPSEAVRSSEIIPEVSRTFEIVERRDYGGAVLSVLYPAIDWERAGTGRLHWLIDRDRDELRRGHSYHAVMLLRPRRGLRRALGALHHHLSPKLRTARYHLMRAAGREDVRW